MASAKPCALVYLDLRRSLADMAGLVDVGALEIFPGESQHDAGLQANQAERGSHVEKNNVELQFRHSVVPQFMPLLCDWVLTGGLQKLPRIGNEQGNSAAAE